MVDINTHNVVDMINSRELKDVTKWLKTYPNIQIVSRDGSITYHNAITESHPNAIQISDRFHLLKNLTDYCKEYLQKELKQRIFIPATVSTIINFNDVISKENQNRKLTLYEKYQKISYLLAEGKTKSQICALLNMDIRAYAKLIVLTDKEAEKYFLTVKNERSFEKVTYKIDRVYEVKVLKEKGYSLRQIAKITDLDRRTVAKYLNPDFTPIHNSLGKTRYNLLTSYKEYINQQLNLGIMTTHIEKEIRHKGYNGSSSTIRNYCSNWKKSKISNVNIADEGELITEELRTETLERKDIFKLLYYPLEKVKFISREQFNNLLKTSPAFAKIHSLLWEFKSILSTKDSEHLSIWIEHAKSLKIKEINSFINGINRDIEAVFNAVRYDYSNGLAEGSVNKLKVIKRIMYGRCNFDSFRIKTLRLEKMRKIN